LSTTNRIGKTNPGLDFGVTMEVKLIVSEPLEASIAPQKKSLSGLRWLEN
jgi:hypothetical protein